MTTAAEARQRWCPFARAITEIDDGVSPAHNRDCRDESAIDDGSWMFDRETRCIADDCMAWRWRLHHDGERTPTENGYCGLAGPG